MSDSIFQKIPEICVFLFKHSLFAILHKIFGLKATKIMRRKVWEIYSKSDVVIICHDSLFYPLYHPIVTLFCKFLGKKLVIYGATFNLNVKAGNFSIIRKMGAKYLMNIVLTNIDLITLREELSYQLLQEIGVNSTSMYITGDLPFLLKPSGEKRVREIMKRESLENCNPIIGMTIGQHKLGLVFSDIHDQKMKYIKFIDTINQVVNYLTESLNATVVFIPHCIGPGNKLDDRIIANEIYEKNTQKDKVRIINQEYTPEDLKGLAGKFELFVGMRLHSVVDMVSMGVPSIMLSHHDDYRAHGILGKMLGQEGWIYNIKDLTAPSLINRIDELWNNKRKVKEDLVPKVEFAKNQTMLNGQLLAKLIKEAE